MMSINAVKGVEIGEGMAAAALTGTENADEMRAGNNGPRFKSNHAGGILGGISNGDPVVVRFAVKPTSSILTPRETVTIAQRGHRGRHQRPPRPVRRHPRRADRRSDDGLRPGRPLPAPPRPDRPRRWSGVLMPIARPVRGQDDAAARRRPRGRGFLGRLNIDKRSTASSKPPASARCWRRAATSRNPPAMSRSSASPVRSAAAPAASSCSTPAIRTRRPVARDQRRRRQRHRRLKGLSGTMTIVIAPDGATPTVRLHAAASR